MRADPLLTRRGSAKKEGPKATLHSCQVTHSVRVCHEAESPDTTSQTVAVREGTAVCKVPLVVTITKTLVFV